MLPPPPSVSVRCHFEFTSNSLRLHFDSTYFPHHLLSESASMSLRFHFVLHCDIISSLLPLNFDFISMLLRFRFGFTSSPRRRHYVSTELSHSIVSRNHCDRTLISLRIRFQFTAARHGKMKAAVHAHTKKGSSATPKRRGNREARSFEIELH